jgi:CHAT domain-containing protein/Flp pilus assembly protein TadD
MKLPNPIIFLDPRFYKNFLFVNFSELFLAFGAESNMQVRNSNATKYFEKKNGWKITKARCYKNQAEYCQYSGKYEEAIEYYNKAIELFQEKDCLNYIGCCYHNLATNHLESRKYDEAIDNYRMAKQTYEKAKNVEYAAIAQMGVAETYRELENYDEAIKIYSQVKETFGKKLKYVNEAMKCRFDLGLIYMDLNKIDESSACFESVIKILDKNPNKKKKFDCYFNIAKLKIMREQYDSAFDLLDNLKNDYGKINDIFSAGKCLYFQAQILIQNNLYEFAIKLLEEALDKFAETNHYSKTAKCYIDLSGCYAISGDLDKARRLNIKAVELLNIDDNDIHNEKERIEYNILAEKNATNIEYRRGNYESAIAKYQEILCKYKNKIKPDQELSIKFNIASVYNYIGKHDKSKNIFESILKEYKKSGADNEIELCNLNLAAIEMSLENYKNAYKLYVKLTKSKNQTVRKKSNFGLCYTNYKLGNIGLAKKFCQKAIDELEVIYNSFSDKDIRYSNIGTMVDIYSMMVELYLSENNFQKALEYVERLKSRQLSELLQYRNILPDNITTDIRKKYLDLKVKIQSISNILNNSDNLSVLLDESKRLNNEYQKIVKMICLKNPDFNPDKLVEHSLINFNYTFLQSGQAIVELFIMPEKIVAFIIRNDMPIEESSIIIHNNLKTNIFDIIRAITEINYKNEEGKYDEIKPGSESFKKIFECSMGKLYELLLKDILTKLDGINSIILIPYGYLHLLPFHSVICKKNGKIRYLIDDFTVSYAPSLNILTQKTNNRDDPIESLLVAHSNPSNDSVPLAYGKNEIEEIKKIFTNVVVLENTTKENLIKQCESHSILHYTGHASQDALFLHDGNDLNSTKKFTIQEIYDEINLKNNYLVALSACETGKTFPKGADEFFGITSGFIYAGAETVISSLWSVPDRPTSLLMKKMYSHIKEGQGKAEALRNAQIWLRDFKDDSGEIDRDVNRGFTVESTDYEKCETVDYSNPYYWAGFICTGAQ